MLCHCLRKFSLYFLIIIYLSLINLDAFVMKDKSISEETANQQKEVINLDNPLYAKYKCPSKFGAFPDVEDCSKFYICVAGFGRRMPCPPFTHFDKHRRRCLSIIVAICDKGEEEDHSTPAEGKETTQPDENVSTVEVPEFLCPVITGTFPHPTDCSKYYACSSFLPTLKTCPANELFDGVKIECRPEAEVNCGSRTRPTSETTLVTKPLLPESTPEVTPTPEVPSLETTTPEETTTEEEPTGPPETDCDEDDLDCIITETGLIPKWFKCPVELGSYRHPSSKKLFIFCINWKPYVKKCGQDLVYSQELDTCVPP